MRKEERCYYKFIMTYNLVYPNESPRASPLNFNKLLG